MHFHFLLTKIKYVPIKGNPTEPVKASNPIIISERTKNLLSMIRGFNSSLLQMWGYGTGGI